MSLPTSEPIPDDIEKLPPARRRRSRRLIVPPDAGERAALLDDLAHRATPGIEFFLASLLAGLAVGAGVWLDSPAVLVLAAVIAPFLAPLIGLALATILGSLQFFARMLGAVLLGSVLVFGGGALAGLLAGLLPARAPLHAPLLAQFSWVGITVLGLAAAAMTVLFARDSERRLLPGAVVAYLLYLPLGAAGYGLVSGVPGLMPAGLVVFFGSLAIGVVLATIALGLLGFRPLTLSGYILGTTFVLVGFFVVVGLSGLGATLGTQLALPTSTPTLAWTPTALPAPTETPAPPTLTSTPTRTLVPSRTPTLTLTPAPTPIWAVVSSTNGAYIRGEPGANGQIIGTVLQGALVQVLPETAEVGGTLWVRIITDQGREGWIVQALLATATPAPNW